MVAGSDIEQIHIPVLLEETLEFLNPRSGGVYVDGTLGLGGHSSSILKRSAPDGKVFAFEWDETAIALARARLSPYKDRLQIIRRNFAEISEGLNEEGVTGVDGLLVDVGLQIRGIAAHRLGVEHHEVGLVSHRNAATVGEPEDLR